MSRFRYSKDGHPGREYWSRRYPGYLPWGKIGKELTHAKERMISKQTVYKEKIKFKEDVV